MKKLLCLILVVATIFISSFAWATAGVCTQGSVARFGNNMQELVFTCTAGSTDHLFPTGGTAVTNAVNTSAISGAYITEVMVSPGGTAPTEATVVAINTADSPAWDVLGGVGVCSATITKRFGAAALTLPVGGNVAKTIDGPLTMAISSNLVNSAIVIIKIIMWKN